MRFSGIELAYLEARAGITLREVWRVRRLMLSVGLLTGPSPLGQFNGGETAQVGLTVQNTF